MSRWKLFVPLILFMVLAVLLLRGLNNDPTELPSALVGKAFPEFALSELADPQRVITQAELRGRPILVNVWATWCFACRIEHPMMNQLAEQGVVIAGLNYKDDRDAALSWLKERGDPYLFSIDDAQGSLGFDLGVYGAPETYLVDAQGIVRHRRVGVVDERVWNEEFLPLLKQMGGAAMDGGANEQD